MKANPVVSQLQKFFCLEHIILAGRAALGMEVVLRAWKGNGVLQVALPVTVCQDVLAAVLSAGGNPIFCDIDPATGLVPEREWLRARSRGANAAVLVHLFGNPANSNQVRAIFPKGECILVDDAAQAFGTTCEGQLAGTVGDVGLLSFGKTKQIEVGGGALLIQDACFARECQTLLSSINSASADEVIQAQACFSQAFFAARAHLVASSDRSRFLGLLSTGYMNTLRTAWDPEWSAPLSKSLKNAHQILASRFEKATLWQQITKDAGFLQIGMKMENGCSPWRFTCRIPGLDWQSQYAIGESLRKKQINVSHWYTPVSWLMEDRCSELPGAEQLAREVFQFWIDERTTITSIKEARSTVMHALEEFTIAAA